MSVPMTKRPTLEISGITMIYAIASLGGFSLALGIFGLPGVVWSKVLPFPPALGGLGGTLLSAFVLVVAISLYRLQAWARSIVLTIQTVVGVLFPLFWDPKPFLPMVDIEFVILARGICVLASLGIIYYLAMGRGRRLFEGGDRPASEEDCYCPLCLDRFEKNVALCPLCGVPVLQSFVDEEGATFANRVAAQVSEET